MEKYDHKSIEKKWQEKWDKEQLYKAPERPKNKQYILDMFPYPSGAGLHVGHPEGYTATDILSRFLRMNGYDVLHPMGWDAFGLPAENYAIKEGVRPDVSIAKNISRFREQIKSIGLSYDWSREVNTSDPEYYRWTQWLFLQFYKKGLAYKKEAYVNWCPQDQTVLANEQVIDGCCERCGTKVIQKLLSQWFFKITDYADRLLADLDKLDWPEPIKLMQRNWVGRSEGAEIEFGIENQELGNKNCLIIHGVSGNGKENWFPWLKKFLKEQNLEVFVPDLPNTDHAKVEEWTDVLQKYNLDQNSVIVGHSVGVPAALNLVQTVGKKIDKLLMVAPVNPNQPYKEFKKTEPDLDWDAVKGFAEIKFDWEKINSLVNEIVFYYSDNDKYIPADSVEFYKKHLPNAIFRFMPGKGHFNTSSGVTEFPEILNDLIPSIKVFTTRLDTLFGATYMVLAPEHPLVAQITSSEQKKEVEKYIEDTKKKTEMQRTALEKEKTGVFTGSYAINPATKEKIPIWIADYVLMGYGTGAIMAVPAHDERDFAFAKKYKLPVRQVITPTDPLLNLRGGEFGKELAGELYTGEGVLVNSGKFDDLTSEEARKKITQEFGKPKVQYKLRDWIVSRQRYWGAPIPIIYCDKCGMQAVPEGELPVKLPTDVDFQPKGKPPLASSKSFHNVKCPNCGGAATRDSDTMDTFVDSSWYFFRFTDPHNTSAFADKKKMNEWLPVDTYVGGAEHAVLHLLYARFFTKALKDFGFIDFDEPFTKLRNQGLILGPDGEKMSKSRDNVINPDDVIAEFGADAFRMYEMFLGPLEDAKPWQTKGIMGVKRFLDKVWRIGNQHFSVIERGNNVHKLIIKVTSDIQNFKFNTAIAAFMEFLNKNKVLSKGNFETFLILLAPFAPHITEELWQDLGHKDSIHLQHWPEAESSLAYDMTVKVVVQVSGHKRAILEIERGSIQAVVKKMALEDENVRKYLEGKEYKEIFVQDKLINFVVK